MLTDDGKHLYVSWEEYHQLIERLALKVHASGWEFDQILCLARGGLRPGDMLLKVAGQPVKNVGELLTQIAALTPGQSVKLDVVRRNQNLTLDVTPAQRPKLKSQK